jgi:hypothetical protein
MYSSIFGRVGWHQQWCLNLESENVFGNDQSLCASRCKMIVAQMQGSRRRDGSYATDHIFTLLWLLRWRQHVHTKASSGSKKSQSRGSALYLLVSCLDCSSSINMKVAYSTGTSVDIPRTIRLNLGCLLPVACVKSRWEGFPSTQHYYRRFLLFIIHLTATCFGRMTIFKQKYIY